MYFWNIKALKRDLHADLLGERAKFIYMFITMMSYMVINEIAMNAPSGEIDYDASWHWSYSVAAVLVNVIGLITAFRANGGTHGVDFLGKYFSIAFVVGMRLLPISLVIAFLSIIVSEGAEDDQVASVMAGGSYLAIFLLFYWRVCKHIGDIRVDNVPQYDSPQKSNLMFWVLSALVFVPFLGLVTLGAYYGDSLPETYVVTGEEIEEDQLAELHEAKVIDEGEEILLFGSSGIFSVLEEGNILTESRAVSYYEDGGELIVDSIEYGDIKEMYLSHDGEGWLEDTDIDIYGADEEYILTLMISAEGDGDERFIEVLKNKTGLEIIEEDDEDWDDDDFEEDEETESETE